LAKEETELPTAKDASIRSSSLLLLTNIIPVFYPQTLMLTVSCVVNNVFSTKGISEGLLCCESANRFHGDPFFVLFVVGPCCVFIS